MKLPIAIASLFVVMSTALPAFAAMPASTSSLRDAAATPIETVQYRQTPRQTDRYQAYRYRNGYNAYASQNRAPNSANARSHDVIPGWPCESHSVDSAFYSAYPAWEMCN